MGDEEWDRLKYVSWFIALLSKGKLLLSWWESIYAYELFELQYFDVKNKNFVITDLFHLSATLSAIAQMDMSDYISWWTIDYLD